MSEGVGAVSEGVGPVSECRNVGVSDLCRTVSDSVGGGMTLERLVRGLHSVGGCRSVGGVSECRSVGVSDSVGLVSAVSDNDSVRQTEAGPRLSILCADLSPLSLTHTQLLVPQGLSLRITIPYIPKGVYSWCFHASKCCVPCSKHMF